MCMYIACIERTDRLLFQTTRCSSILDFSSLVVAMGLTLSSVFSRLFGKKQMRILMGG